MVQDTRRSWLPRWPAGSCQHRSAPGPQDRLSLLSDPRPSEGAGEGVEASIRCGRDHRHSVRRNRSPLQLCVQGSMGNR